VLRYVAVMSCVLALAFIDVYCLLLLVDDTVGRVLCVASIVQICVICAGLVGHPSGENGVPEATQGYPFRTGGPVP
jgi:hypothetical protein